MELHAPIPFPPAVVARHDATDEIALAEIDVAIALVAGGVANRVRVANVADAIADDLAGIAAARAGAAGVRFVMERSSRSRTLTIGPRGR
jgi:hypothetical protein